MSFHNAQRNRSLNRSGDRVQTRLISFYGFDNDPPDNKDNLQTTEEALGDRLNI